MNDKGYKNHAIIGGIATMCGYYDSAGMIKNPDGPVCEHSPQKDEVGKLCEHFFNGGMCRNMKVHNGHP
jgi:hypothetical protein